jgi:hypothetical protein
MKRQVLVLAAVLCVTAFAQYDQVWQSDEVGLPASIHVIGVANTDYDDGPELVYVGNEPWYQNEVYIWVLDLRTGEIDQLTDEFYDIVTDSDKQPRLVNAEGNGPSEILFLATEDPGEAYTWYLYACGQPSGSAEPGYHRVSGPHLGQNVPNPLGRRTSIVYEVPSTGQVNLRIYDASGRLVKNINAGKVEAGSHTAVWHRDDDRGSQVPAGTYFYVLETDGKELTRKALVTE